MPEPTTQPLPEAPGQDFVYRPLSGVAVAAIIVAGLYAVLLLVFAVTALRSGDPFLLPLWLLLLPAAGVVLALLGRWHILRSEDTRAGMPLTRWALVIALVTGLGYATYYFVTGLAITTQANNFLLVKGPDSGFLTRLQAGDVNTAFLLTRPLSDRSGANPNDDEAMEDQFNIPAPGDRSPGGLLSMFRSDPVVRRLAAAGNSAKIEPLGVKNWTYENKGYKVDRLYRIETNEGSFEMLLSTQSTSVPGENYKWFVHWQPKMAWASPLKLTPKGKRNMDLRSQSAQFANAWFGKINRREVLQAYLDTQPAQQRPQLVRILNGSSVLTCLPTSPTVGSVLVSVAFTVSPQPLQEQLKAALLPGFEEFLEGRGSLHSELLRQRRHRCGHSILHKLSGFVKEPIQGQFQLHIRPEEVALSKIEETPPGRLLVTHQFDFPLSLSGSARQAQQQQVAVVGEIVLEAVAGADPNDQNRWRIVRVDFLRAFSAAPGGKGQPGG